MTSAPRTHRPALSTGLVPVPAVFKERELARLVRIGLLVPLALGAALQPGLPWAAPTGGQVVGGSGSIQSGGNLTEIQQGSHRLAIDWQSYNVGANETVRYLQPSASAAALNRVLDGNPSQILGRIEANGQVFLMNPSGIIFGRTATVNVGSLVAAAMDMDKAKFMNGLYEMGVPEGIEPGMVVNQGLLAAATGGSVTLVGGAVKNEGAIIAKLGQVNLGAGRRAVVDFEGNDIIRFAVDGELTANTHQVESAVSNTGTIDAAGGTVLMTAKTAGDVFTSVVNNEGIVRAGGIDTQGGEIRLTGSGGLVRNSGTLDASGTTGGKVSVKGLKIDHTGRILAEGRGGAGGQAVLEAVDTTTVSKGGVISVRAAGGPGGSADVLGERVALLDQARIDASGTTGGGKIRVGGDYQGKNAAVKNAKRTHVGAGVTMAADAGERGDGGTVIVWADEDTRYFGAISAVGGEGGGNGGMAEVSGKTYLDYSGTADLRAAAGVAGTLLLDPADLTISDKINDNVKPDPASNDDVFIYIPGGLTSDETWVSTVSVTALQDQLAKSNVIVRTLAGSGGKGTGDITVAVGITAPNDTTDNKDNNLTLDAYGNIKINAAIDFSKSSGDLNLWAGTQGTRTGDGLTNITNDVNGSIQMGGGNLDLKAGNGIGVSLAARVDIKIIGEAKLTATTRGRGVFINNVADSNAKSGLTLNGVTAPNTIDVTSEGTLSIAGTVEGSSIKFISSNKGVVQGAGALISATNKDASDAGIVIKADDKVTLLNTVTAADVPITIGAPLILAGDVTLSSGKGAITLAQVDATTAGAEGLRLTGSGLTTLKAAVGGNFALKSLTLDGGGTAKLAGNVTTKNGLIDIGDTLTLTGDAVLSSGSGAITLAQVDADAAGAQGLTLTGSGLTTLKAAVGGNFALKSLILDGGGTAKLAGNVTTKNGLIDIGDTLTLTGDAVLSSGSGAITLAQVDATTAGAQSLTLTGSGLTTLKAAVGGNFALKSLTLDSGGTAKLAGNVTTKNGLIDIGDTLTLTGDAVLSSGSGAITLAQVNATTAGAQGLTLTGSGLTTLGGALGGTALKSLTVNGDGETQLAANVTTTKSGPITFADTLTLTQDVVLASGGGAIRLAAVNATEAGKQGLTLDSGAGVTTLGGVVGATALKYLTTDAGAGATELGSNVSTTGAITFGDNLKLLGNVTLDTTAEAATGAAINLASVYADAAANTRTLTLNAGTVGVVTATGGIGTQTDGKLAELTLTNSGGASFAGITAGLLDLQGTTGTKTITVNGALTLDTLTTTKAGYNLALLGGGTVDKATTIENGGTLTLGAAGKTLTFTNGLTANPTGTLTLAGTIKTTKGDMKLNKALTLTADAVLDSGDGAITLEGKVNAETAGVQGLTLTGKGLTTIKAALGETKALKFLAVNGAGGTKLAANVTTSGGGEIKFADALTLTADAVLKSGDGAITLEGKVNAATAGEQGLTLTGKGLTTIKAALGETALKFLTVDGEGETKLAANITTSDGGEIKFADALILTADAVLRSGTGKITLAQVDATTAGQQGLTLTGSGLTKLGGAVGTTALEFLTVDGNGTAELAGNVTTSGGAIKFHDALSLTGNVTLDTTRDAPKGADITLKGVSGSAAGSTLTLDAGTDGIVGTGTIGTNIGTLTLTNSGGATFAGITAGTLNLQDTTDTITVTGALNLSTLTTTTNGYNLALLGGGTVGTATSIDEGVDTANTIANVGDLTLGDAVGDTLIFTNGLTANPTGTLTLAGTIQTTNADITFKKALTLTQDVELKTGTGAIKLNGAVDADTAGVQGLTLTGGDTILGAALGGTKALEFLTVNGGGNTELAANITTQATTKAPESGAITFEDALILTKAVALASGGGDITFNSTLNGDRNTPAREGLTLTAGAGNITFGGAVGSMDELGAIDIVSANDLKAAAMTAVKLKATVTGTATLTGNLKLSGEGGVDITANQFILSMDSVETTFDDSTKQANIVFAGNTELGNVIVSALKNDMSFSVAGANSDITLKGNWSSAPSSTKAPPADGWTLTVTYIRDEDDTFKEPNFLPGSTPINFVEIVGTAIKDSWVIPDVGYTFNTTVRLIGNVTFSQVWGTVQGPLVFMGRVITSNGYALTIGDLLNDPLIGDMYGNVEFNRDIGDTKNRLGAITIATGKGVRFASSVASTSLTVSANRTTLGGDITIDTKDGPIRFEGSIEGSNTGGQSLTLNSTGTTTINGSVGATTALKSLTTDSGGGTWLGGNVRTQGGAITFNDALTLTADAVLASGGGAITLAAVNATTVGGQGLTLNSGAGVTTLGGVIGATALKHLTTDAGTGATELGSNVSTTGAITFADTLTLVQDVVLASGGGAIKLAAVNATTAGGQGLTLNSGVGVTTLGGVIGATALKHLTTDAGTGATELGSDVSTTGAITFGDNLKLLGNVVLDTTKGAATGATINLASVSADAAANNRTLTLNAGTAGEVKATGGIGTQADGALAEFKLTNSGGATFAGITAGTLNLQDTTDAIAVTGALNLGNLTTTTKGYNLALLGGGTVTGATTINNQGTLTLGNGDDSFTFVGGLTVTAPRTFNLGGTVASGGSAGLTLGDDKAGVKVTHTSTVGGTGSGALALGKITLADGVTLTVGTGRANAITLGTVSGTSGGLVSNLKLNSTGTIGVGTIGTDIGSVTLLDSGGATFAGIGAGTLDLQDTKGRIQVDGDLTLGQLTTGVKGYDLLLLGSNNSVTKAVTFLNTGTLTLGDGAGDSSHFIGGLTATAPTAIKLAGTIQTTGQAITIGDAGAPIVLMANAALDTTVGGSDGAITLGGSVNDKDTAATSSLTLTAGTDAVVFGADIGATNPLAAVKIASAGSVTFAGITADALDVGTLAPNVGSLTVAGNLRVNTLTTTTNPYNLAFLGSKNEIKNRVTFNHSGTLTLGDGAADLSHFIGGLTATAPMAIKLAGTLQTTGQAIIIGDADSSIVLTANVALDTTVGGGDGAITVGGSVNDKDAAGASSLTLTAGTDAVVFGADIGATNPLAAVKIASAGSVTFAGITADALDVGTLAATVDSLTVAGNLKVNTLTTSGLIVNLALLGSANEVTEQVTFNNSGILTLGDAQTDTSRFQGGLSATSQRTIRLAGNILTSNDAIVLGGGGTNVSFTKNTLLSSGGGTITLRGNLDGGSLTLQADSGTVQIETTGTLDPVGSIAARELRVSGAARVGTAGQRLATQVGNLALTDVRGSAFLQNTGNLTFLNSNLAGDLDLVNAGTVALHQVQTPGQVTLTATGGLTDANGGAANLVADRLVIKGGAAVASSRDALETQVRQLQLTTGAAAITNTGSLQVADSQVSGRLALSSSGDLVLNAIAAGGQSVALRAGGDILDGNGIGTNLTAADLSLSAGGGIGVADLLETAVSTLGFSAGETVRIANQGALEVSGQAGVVELSATDLLYVIGEGISGASGVDLRADQLLTIDAPISTNSGTLLLVGATGVNQNADLEVTGGGGEIYVYTKLVDFNVNQSFVGGAISMAPNTSTRNLGGSIEYAAANTVTLGTLEGKTVRVTAVNGDVIAADPTSAIYADVATIQALGGSIGAGPTEPLRFGGNAQEINLAFDGQAFVDSIDGRPLDAIATRADYAEYALTPGGALGNELIRRLMSGGNLVVLSSAARDASGQSQRTGEEEPEDVNESLLRGEQEITKVEDVGTRLPADQLEDEAVAAAPVQPSAGEAVAQPSAPADALGQMGPDVSDELPPPLPGIELSWQGSLVPTTRGAYLFAR